MHAADCGPPFSSNVKLQDDSLEDALMGELRAAQAVWDEYDNMYVTHYSAPTAPSKSAGKQKAATTSAAEPQPPPKKERPVGSKDKQPRQQRSQIVKWEYGGKHGPAGTQFAKLGDDVVHNQMGVGVLVAQSGTALTLQKGTGEDAFVVTVSAAEVRYIMPAGSSSTAQGSSRKGEKRATGQMRKKREPLAQPESAIQKKIKKADAESIKNRKRRELSAATRGKPLKPARQKLNKNWPPALKDQAVSLYNSKYATSKAWAACVQELKKMPAFHGITRGHLQGWVAAADKLAAQDPNKFGLIVTQAGRPPVLPEALYNELKEQLVGLAKTKAFTLNSTTLKPVVLAFVLSKLSLDAIHPGRGGFVCGPWFVKKLAQAAKLKWRKPFGDARKHPPNAAALIQDMILRLAYHMHEHDVPPALVVNFDHTGMHFMQMRGNTWTLVEEDTDTPHQSRPAKEKETKQQNKGDKRQATGTVGTSMAGDVLPGQLLVEGVQHGHGALPTLAGNKYISSSGSNAGHAVGFKLAQAGTDANAGRLTRTWLAHLAQTPNHWANIKTSYAILEFIIVPWLLAKKAAIGKAADAVCVLIVDCWYGWKDQDKKKTLISFRHYVRDHYPWIRLLFVPAACTDLAQPADRGFISWLKANMRAYYTDIISKEVLRQMQAGADVSTIKIDTSAGYMKQMLTNSFAKALSELPSEKVVACWQPLQTAWDDRVALHAKAKEELQRLFPNHVVDVGPDETEPEPDPLISDETGDDFDNDSDDDAAYTAIVEAHAHLFGS